MDPTAVAIIGWFVQVLFDQGITFLKDHWGSGAAGDPDLPGALVNLRDAMNNVSALLPPIRTFRGENEGLLNLMKELKDAAYEAEDIFSELEYHLLQQQVEGGSKKSRRRNFKLGVKNFFSRLNNQASTSSSASSNLVPQINDVAGRLEKITTDIRGILLLLKLEELQQNPHVSPVASHRITTSLLPVDTLIGRVTERDEIIRLLLLPEESVSMVPIVGIGGVGKTTLAQMVYNNEQIKKHFDSMIWVCVSDGFDVAGLTREMLQCLRVDGWHHITNLNTLQELLMKKLQSERFLLVLDDVWNDSERGKWGSLCAPLRLQKRGSRILMTTRQNTVVRMAGKIIHILGPCPLEGLPEDQYLSFFNAYAFGDENPSDYRSLVDIGKQIAGRLKGSPLAAKTLGGLLSEKLNEDHWSSIRDSDLWQLRQSNDDIMPILQLSYQHLPPHLQQCFIYCCVFPKDRKFEKKEMVGMWISHGYVHTKSGGNKSVEEIGSEYLDALLSRSFIEAYDLERYVLHDLLHDLAKSVSENEYLEINRKATKEITPSVRHVYVHSNNLDLLKGCNLRNLRTLIIDGSISGDDSVLKEVLNGLKSIRVLNLERVSVEFWSGSIGHLIHLRYLAVNSSNHSMPPDSQCRPYHLQWLIFYMQDEGYVVLPAATDYLVSLRHFGFTEGNNDGWDQISEMSGIGKLICLQELNRFTVGKNEGRKIAELKGLNELRGTLALYSLDNVSTKEAALEASLNEKVRISKLALWCGFGHESPQMAEEVFEGLCPPPCIKKLTLDHYLGVESPTWMMPVKGCLSFLQSLTLDDCRNWKVLPPLGQLPLLRYLKIYRANAVEEIGSSFYGSGVAQSFPSLETLVFEPMPEWVVWSGVKEHTDSLFPRLRELTVMNCPKLERVPMQCLASVEALKTNCTVLLANCGEIQSLLTLEIEFCDVQSLLTTETKLPSLREITITKCDQLQSLFTTETETETETKFPSLREITISWCDQLVSVELESLPSLKKLAIRSCDRIQSVPVLPATLEELNLARLLMLTAFSREQEENLSDLTSLQKIVIENCCRLHSLPLMPASLQRLKISGCWKLHSLPLMPASLQHLDIQLCPELPRETYQEGGDDWHKISHVPNIDWD